MTNFIKLFWGIVIGSLIFMSCQNTNTEKITANDTQPPKYIFLFIGDGMGISHVKLTEAYLHSLSKDNPGFSALSFDTLPVAGLSTTHANNRLITGSAAAGTALATGHKTNIGRISKSPDGIENYKSIAYRFQEKGFKIGIVTSVSINHATPAVFYANQDSRKYYYSIGLDLIDSEFDFFGGGGFHKADSLTDQNLYTLAENAGYNVIRETTNLDTLKVEGKLMLVNPILGTDSEMPYAIDRKYERGYSLADITKVGIQQLMNDDGFFMMVEGGKIDWASHENDAATIVHEMIDFDLAVQQALNFYLEHPDECLIIVTSDHETGGLSLGNAAGGYDTDFALLKKQQMSYYRSRKISMDKSFDKSMIEDIFGINDLSNWETSMLKQAKHPQDNPDYHMDYGAYHPYLKTCNNILNLRSGVGFTNWDHTAEPVPVFAIGHNQSLFYGNYDNTDIPKKIMKICNMD
ncbi:MAG: alkaline phosphatase [Bacteroidota bacterium]|nr:alkaline phosphatase [Bacteroidota bacterium]